MNYCVYIIKSLKTEKRYIGYTSNFSRRFQEHQSSNSKFTSRHKPFKVVFRKSFASKSEAMKYERYIKSLKGGNQLFIEMSKL